MTLEMTLTDSEKLARLDAEELRRLVATVLELPVEEVTDQADFVEELELDSLT